jgi:hypothetical protein
MTTLYSVERARERESEREREREGETLSGRERERDRAANRRGESGEKRERGCITGSFSGTVIPQREIYHDPSPASLILVISHLQFHPHLVMTFIIRSFEGSVSFILGHSFQDGSSIKSSLGDVIPNPQSRNRTYKKDGRRRLSFF